MIPKTLKVVANDDIRVYNHDMSKLIASVDVGQVFYAELYEPTEEYFTEDSEGRRVYVAELDVMGNRLMDGNFEVLEELHPIKL